MGGALDAVLKIKAQEQQAEQFKSEQLTSAVGLLQNAQQIQSQKKLQEAQAANLLSEAKARQGQEMISNLIKGSQLKKSGMETRDRGLLDAGNILIKNAMGLPATANQYMGETGKITPPISLTPVDTQDTSMEQQSLQKDEFGDPTAEALKAKNDLEVKQSIEKKQKEGIPTSEAGKVALADESVKNIDDIINILYPDGTPKSFKRGIATGSNLPGITLPFLGRITPQVRPDNPLDKGDDKAAEQAQDVFRKMGAALAGRQLIQTGVAARPEENAKLVGQFAPGTFSNAESGLKALIELKDFYKSYKNNVVPTREKNKKEEDFNPKTHKKQRNKKTGEIRIVPK